MLFLARFAFFVIALIMLAATILLTAYFMDKKEEWFPFKKDRREVFSFLALCWILSGGALILAIILSAY